MITVRKLTRGAAAALLGTTGVVAATLLTAAPAHAAPDPSTCTSGTDLSRNWVSWTCYNPVDSVWDIRVECDKFSGGVVYVNGTRSYGAGWGHSNAQCPVGTELGEATLQNL